MRLSLHPNPGNGMTWEMTLYVGDEELSSDAGHRTFYGGSLHGRVDELDQVLDRCRALAKVIGLAMEVEHDSSHWDWEP